MKSLIDKGISVFRNDGLWVFLNRVMLFGIIKVKRLRRGKDYKNIERWELLKGKFKGERLFIIGNGPSLNKMPLHLLKDEYTMAFNRFNLMFERLNWHPSFYMVTDDLVVVDMFKQINDDILPNVSHAFFPDIHPSNVEFDRLINNKKNVYWLNTDKPEFRYDLPRCGINKTVVNAGVQVGAFLGFTEIYLIGVDMSFFEHKVKRLNSRNWEASEEDPNHFDPRYFGNGAKYHNPTVHEMVEKFERCKDFVDGLGVKVYNAGFDSKLEVFEKVNFNSLFNIDEKEVVANFDSLSFLQKRNLTINVLDKSEFITCEKLVYPEVFKTSTEMAFILIPKLILEFLPIGPYNSQMYFVRRTYSEVEREPKSSLSK